MSQVNTTILVASDNPSDATLVRSLLIGDFPNVLVTTSADRAVEDFERCQPAVIVLAFNTLEKSERFYLGLYRLSARIQMHPHRTVILCHKDEVNQVAALCLKQHFDDYMLFWPMSHDAPRLVMSVHLALRGLAAIRDQTPSMAQFAAHARSLAELEGVLQQRVRQGSQQIEAANMAVQQASRQVEEAFENFTHRGVAGAPTSAEHVSSARQQLSAATNSVQPLMQWVDELEQECAPHLQTVRDLNSLAATVRPDVLVIDDDEFQHKMVAKILGADNYKLTFASGGAQALNILRNSRPDLILMDIEMPDMNGLEMTTLLKNTPRLCSVPIMMISGKSESNTVRNCLKAGAVDFVVKPFDRQILQAKVARLSRP